MVYFKHKFNYIIPQIYKISIYKRYNGGILFMEKKSSIPFAHFNSLKLRKIYLFNNRYSLNLCISKSL